MAVSVVVSWTTLLKELSRAGTVSEVWVALMRRLNEESRRTHLKRSFTADAISISCSTHAIYCCADCELRRTRAGTRNCSMAISSWLGTTVYTHPEKFRISSAMQLLHWMIAKHSQRSNFNATQVLPVNAIPVVHLLAFKEH